MAGQPFIAFEWGSEVVYALAYRAAGLAGVAVLAGLVLALTYALVARFLIRRGGDPLLAYFVSMAAAVLSAAHWLARPHLFTMLAVVLLLELLETRGRRTALAVLRAVRGLGQPARRVLLRLHHDRHLRRGRAARGAAFRRGGPRGMARPRAPPRGRARRRAGGEHRATRTGSGTWPTWPGSSATRDPAADPGVHEPGLPHHQRQDLPAGAAGRHRDLRPDPPAADPAGPADRSSPTSPSRSSPSGTSSSSP